MKQPEAQAPSLSFLAKSYALVGLAFTVIYGGSDRIAAMRELRLDLFLDAELQIPFIPLFVLVYVSLYPMMFMAPWIIRSESRLRYLVHCLMWQIVIGGVFFALIPARLAFPDHQDIQGFWRPFYLFADVVNLDFNLVPSLHVTFAVTLSTLYADPNTNPGRGQKQPWIAAGFWIWGILISASTVLTHQHHLLDVLTGAFLAWATMRLSDWSTESMRGSKTVKSKR